MGRSIAKNALYRESECESASRFEALLIGATLSIRPMSTAKLF